MSIGSATQKVVIIGGGLAGHRAATTIAGRSTDAEVVMISAEDGLPYDRPPLSKEFLTQPGEQAPFLRNGDIYGGRVTLLNRTALRIDRPRSAVILDDGRVEPYERLIIATGSRPRRIDTRDVDPALVHYLRTLDDAVRLRRLLRPGARVAVVGGGFIGLEVAASARKLGCKTLVVELAHQVLSRVGFAPLSHWVAAAHERDGSVIALGCAGLKLAQIDRQVHLSWQGGESIADVVVIGIGVTPNAELAAEAGLETADGIVVDAAGQTSDPDIFAAGEVTNYQVGALKRRLRSESWAAAGDQAEVVARSVMGEAAEYSELPWFWSDQCGADIQALGMPGLAHRHFIIGETTGERWLDIGLDAGGALVGAVGVNMGREISLLRRNARLGRPVAEALLGAASECRSYVDVAAT